MSPWAELLRQREGDFIHFPRECPLFLSPALVEAPRAPFVETRALRVVRAGRDGYVLALGGGRYTVRLDRAAPWRPRFERVLNAVWEALDGAERAARGAP
ncbi:MAG TPA: hypothetical protein VFD92_04840 [Candidatus Binatia bacterium]|nr:hypothetical protein [Candidatus Binatia bacterium]